MCQILITKINFLLQSEDKRDEISVTENVQRNDLLKVTSLFHIYCTRSSYREAQNIRK